MNNVYNIIWILTIYLTCCFSSHSQTTDRIAQINNFCDSLDNVKTVQTITKAGIGITLDYIISNGDIIKIIEHPIGYKFISAKETYYIQSNQSVYVYADIEISCEDGEKLTIELHKIYIDNNRIIKQMTSEQTFNADSLYNDSSDPVKTAENIRKNARFKPRSINLEFEKTLLQAIGNYIKARTKKDGDPFFDELYSPFI